MEELNAAPKAHSVEGYARADADAVFLEGPPYHARRPTRFFPPVCRAKNRARQMLIHPSMDPEFIRQTVREHGVAGLKCFHVYATTHPRFDAEIPAYLPDEHVRIAHEENLTITLHMVRARALADPNNQHHLRRLSSRYPDAKLLLAHAARGFNPHHTPEGIHSISGLHSIWFDTSAVTGCGAIEAIIETMGAERLLYGSDFPVSHLRGSCVALGDSFVWLDSENPALNQSIGNVTPTLVGLESLRVLKMFSRNLRLSDSDVERVFSENALNCSVCAEERFRLTST